MPPAKKAAPAAAKRSRVMGGAEDEVISDPTPAEAHDSELSSRAKDELFGDPPKDENGVRPTPAEAVTASKPSDAVETEVVPESPPERHESDSYEQDFADKTEADADFDAEEKDSGE